MFLKEGLLEETLTRMKDEADIRTSAMQVLQKALDEGLLGLMERLSSCFNSGAVDATRKFVMSSRNTMEWIFNNFVYGTPADATLCARLLVKVAQDPGTWSSASSALSVCDSLAIENRWIEVLG